MNRQEEVKMTHSGILAADGRRYVSVRFERGKDAAEGRLPDCKITKNHGFSPEETERLEDFMEQKCDEIFQKAREINPIRNW